jgi:hypothetical protein
VQYDDGSGWSAPLVVEPGVVLQLPAPAYDVVFEPVDAYGDPVVVSGNVELGLGCDDPAPPSVSFVDQASITPVSVGVFRFFDTEDGTHFFTASAAERDQIVAARPDFVYEGVGINAVSLAAADPGCEPVYRFFDSTDGTHFFTASASERDTVEATRHDLVFEGVGFYEDRSQQSGDGAVYRFFDTIHGTHLYTADKSERATIIATRADLTPEGIAFYAPHS